MLSVLLGMKVQKLRHPQCDQVPRNVHRAELPPSLLDLLPLAPLKPLPHATHILLFSPKHTSRGTQSKYCTYFLTGRSLPCAQHRQTMLALQIGANTYHPGYFSSLPFFNHSPGRDCYSPGQQLFAKLVCRPMFTLKMLIL